MTNTTYFYKKIYNLIANIPVMANTTFPPGAYEQIVKKLIYDKVDDDTIFWCWKCMLYKCDGTDVDKIEIEKLFGKRLKEVLINKKIREIEEDFQ